jgi:hypothetical protein
MKQTLDKLLYSLLLVRAGQELGTDSRLARLVRDLIDTLISTLGG